MYIVYDHILRLKPEAIDAWQPEVLIPFDIRVFGI